MRTMAMLAVALCALAACERSPSGGAAAPASAEQTPSYAGPTEEQTVAAQTFMETVMQPTAETLWNSVGFVIDSSGEHDLSPQNDEEWAAVGPRADALILVLQGLRGAAFKWDPDDTWNGFIDNAITAAIANKAAGETKTVDAMYEAGEQLDRACEACHDHWEVGMGETPETP